MTRCLYNFNLLANLRLLLHKYSLPSWQTVRLLNYVLSFSDPHSDIASIALCLGRTVLNCDIMPWDEVDVNNTAEGRAHVTYEIPDGIPAWVRLMAENKGVYCVT